MSDAIPRGGGRLIPAAGLAVALLACTSAPASTPSASDAQVVSAAAVPTPSPTAMPTDESIPAASATAAEDFGGLTPDAVAQVVTTDLVVRSLPEIGHASEIYDIQLDEPTLLYVVDGPVSSNGYDWYQVKPFGVHYLDFMQQAPPFGWVAAGSREGEPWIVPAAVDCPDPELGTLREMSEVARLACYGSEELRLQGEFGGCFVADPPIVTPAWLSSTGCALVPSDYQEGAVAPDPGPLRMRMNGSVGIPFDRPRAPIDVTGHFDDPAAASCMVQSGLDPAIERTDPAEVVLDCRTEFVVTHVALLGE